MQITPVNAVKQGQIMLIKVDRKAEGLRRFEKDDDREKAGAERFEREGNAWESRENGRTQIFYLYLQ